MEDQPTKFLKEKNGNEILELSHLQSSRFPVLCLMTQIAAARSRRSCVGLLVCGGNGIVLFGAFNFALDLVRCACGVCSVAANIVKDIGLCDSLGPPPYRAEPEGPAEAAGGLDWPGP